MKNRIITLLLVLFLFSCKDKEVKGIIIGDDLYHTLDYQSNKELSILIQGALNVKISSLSKLNNFWCGGGAGCYDLGFIFTQIVYKIGEGEFLGMLSAMKAEEIYGIQQP